MVHRRMFAAVGFPRDEMKPLAMSYDEMRPGCYEPKARLDDMDDNWVEASLCFPTFPRFCGQTFLEGKDHDLGARVRARYNDWMVEEWCGDSGGRLIPLIIIPLWDGESPPRRSAATPSGRARGDVLRDPAQPRAAVDPLRRVGPVLPGVRRDRHRDQHARRLVVEDARDRPDAPWPSRSR